MGMSEAVYGQAMPTDGFLSWLEIDLSAIRHNYRLIREHVNPETDVYAVIKADAYGHGAVPVAHALLKEGATRFCVARVEEAAELRKGGIDTPILVLAPPFLPQALIAARLQLDIVVCDAVHIKAVAEAQSISNETIGVHIKTDVGMGRLGVPPDDVKGLVELCNKLNVPVDGIMAHLPSADATTFDETVPMLEQFRKLKDDLTQAFPKRKFVYHVANSAATMRCADAWMDAVRCGIALYGQFPSVEMEREFDLRPAMTLKSVIGFIKDVPAETGISYGHIYKTPTAARLATIPIGYADGFPRAASNAADVIIHGKLAPQVGRVCMDQIVVDISGIPGAQVGDEVILFGVGQSQELRAENVAARFGSIGYELTTRIGKRLGRTYLGAEGISVP